MFESPLKIKAWNIIKYNMYQYVYFNMSKHSLISYPVETKVETNLGTMRSVWYPKLKPKRETCQGRCASTATCCSFTWRSRFTKAPVSGRNTVKVAHGSMWKGASHFNGSIKRALSVRIRIGWSSTDLVATTTSRKTNIAPKHDAFEQDVFFCKLHGFLVSMLVLGGATVSEENNMFFLQNTGTLKQATKNPRLETKAGNSLYPRLPCPKTFDCLSSQVATKKNRMLHPFSLDIISPNQQQLVGAQPSPYC